MKKICCFFLAVIICVLACGCQKENIDGNDSDGIEKVELDEEHVIKGKIIEKIKPDILVLKLDDGEDTTWGETVNVVTDTADGWCLRDIISVSFTVVELTEDDTQFNRIVAQKIKVIHPAVPAAKPIIYLYPESPLPCTVMLAIDGELTCTYPRYGTDGWQNFIAYPDGTLLFPDGKEYYALYWEGVQNTEWDFTRGWCVRGEDTSEFLEWALAEQGLNPREANEFIIYWLPLMQNNPYNIISFQTTAYTDSAILEIHPNPDSMLRVFMAYYPSDTEIELPPQTFEVFKRRGFTGVEWGGSQVEKP